MPKVIYVLILMFIVACNEHVCPPPTKVITHYDTVIRQRIDTLVVIQTCDSLPLPSFDSMSKIGMFVLRGGWEQRPGELFKGGKRKDTILKHIVIYY